MPVLEDEFLFDERNEKNMVIGSLDKETTFKLTKPFERPTKRNDFFLHGKLYMKASVSISLDIDTDIMSGDEELVNDTQSNLDDDQLLDFCELDSEFGRKGRSSFQQLPENVTDMVYLILLELLLPLRRFQIMEL